MARPFPLADILSVTTGRLVSPTLGGVTELTDWVGAATIRGCREALLAQHPDLAAVRFPRDLGEGSEDAVGAWLAEQVAEYGETREVTQVGGSGECRI